MKVSYVTMRFPALSETFACTDIRALRQADVNVTVHTLRAPTVDPAALLTQRGLVEFAVDQCSAAAHIMGILACVRRPLLTAKLLWWLVGKTSVQPKDFAKSLALVPRSMGILAALEREQPDVVHLFWGHYPSIVGFLVLTRLPRAVLSVFLGAYDLTTGYRGSAWVAQRADIVSTHARWNFPALESLGLSQERIHLAYRGIDATLFTGTTAQKIRRRMVSVGRLDEGKALDDVLRAFHKVHSKWPDASLRVLGDGPERAKLERLCRELQISSAVTFLGHVTHAEVARELGQAEVFLHMSWEDTERLPNVVKEAMASSCLCVVSQTAGIEELLLDGVQGFVVSLHDIDGVVQRLDEVFTGRIDVRSITTAASDRVTRVFDVSRCMQSYVGRWQEALSRRDTRANKRGDTSDVFATSVRVG